MTQWTQAARNSRGSSRGTQAAGSDTGMWIDNSLRELEPCLHGPLTTGTGGTWLQDKTKGRVVDLSCAYRHLWRPTVSQAVTLVVPDRDPRG